MKTLLYTTTAFVLCSGIVQANAACIATPSCTAMGYSSTSSCDGGLKCPCDGGLKCPFGSYWYCPEEIIKGGECADFPYTCFEEQCVDGAGIGSDCNGKYVKCECYPGAEWKSGQGCVESSTECKLGAILYNDMTCSSSGYDNDKGLKTAIGVVVYIGSDGKRWALALKSIGNYTWGGYGTDISTLPNKTPTEAASKDYDSCGNTEKILAAGNKSKYPAAWAAHEYKTAGTKAGDWCLPAAGIFTSYYNNQSVINTGFSRAGGTKFTNSTYAWSSSENNLDRAWYSIFNRSYGLDSTNCIKDCSFEVRPVIEFQVL